MDRALIGMREEIDALVMGCEELCQVGLPPVPSTPEADAINVSHMLKAKADLIGLSGQAAPGGGGAACNGPGIGCPRAGRAQGGGGRARRHAREPGSRAGGPRDRGDRGGAARTAAGGAAGSGDRPQDPAGDRLGGPQPTRAARRRASTARLQRRRAGSSASSPGPQGAGLPGARLHPHLLSTALLRSHRGGRSAQPAHPRVFLPQGVCRRGATLPPAPAADPWALGLHRASAGHADSWSQVHPRQPRQDRRPGSSRAAGGALRARAGESSSVS